MPDRGLTGEQIRRILAELDGITADDWLIRGDELANANCKAVRRDLVPEPARAEVDDWVRAHRGRVLSHREALIAGSPAAGRLRVYYEIPLKELWPPRSADRPPAVIRRTGGPGGVGQRANDGSAQES